MAKTEITRLRDFPSVEELLQAPSLRREIASLPRPVAAEIVKQTVASFKTRLKGQAAGITVEELHGALRTRLTQAKRREIRRVINASGIIVHTNLGRAPLSEELFDAVKETVLGYGNVEFDLDRGARGERGSACESYLATLSGAEAATVVNNCAAALFIILNTLANRRKVIISRGELVQIGGGFRIPDILKRSGAALVEVGTTNITTVSDYEAAAAAGAAMILKVHKSNFIQAGFTQEVPLKELIGLGRKFELPVVNDLGSGVFIPTRDVLGYAEPTVQQSVRAGADLTCFSGDKMLGGMQAGLIVGRADLIARVKKNPIFRTVRVDKVVFAVLERLLAIYLNGTHCSDIKLWSLLSVPVGELKKRAAAVLARLGNPDGVTVRETPAFMGGGALPESEIPSVGLEFSNKYDPGMLMSRLRAGDPPIVGRVEKDRFLLDLKAVDVQDLDVLISAIRQVIT
ncbi:MAG TPA: L-seryl-tRNA(Sec) selenium transferase [Acidobacteriota bacterium]|nr:L-seryl-tRNA(Sec) selenium transferase [Acidobacteriota bacterium]